MTRRECLEGEDFELPAVSVPEYLAGDSGDRVRQKCTSTREKAARNGRQCDCYCQVTTSGNGQPCFGHNCEAMSPCGKSRFQSQKIRISVLTVYKILSTGGLSGSVG